MKIFYIYINILLFVICTNCNPPPVIEDETEDEQDSELTELDFSPFNGMDRYTFSCDTDEGLEELFSNSDHVAAIYTRIEAGNGIQNLRAEVKLPGRASSSQVWVYFSAMAEDCVAPATGVVWRYPGNNRSEWQKFTLYYQVKYQTKGLVKRMRDRNIFGLINNAPSNTQLAYYNWESTLHKKEFLKCGERGENDKIPLCARYRPGAALGISPMSLTSHLYLYAALEVHGTLSNDVSNCGQYPTGNKVEINDFGSDLDIKPGAWREWVHPLAKRHCRVKTNIKHSERGARISISWG